MNPVAEGKNVELELKFPLHESVILISRLNKKAQTIFRDKVQKDTYFSPLVNDFLSKNPVSEWLRVRESGDKATVNYKHWHNEHNSKAVSCDELETTVADVNVFKRILLELKFKEIVVVEKKRSSWNYKKSEISIDSVTNLGDFMEIEAKGDFDSNDEAELYLFEILEELEAFVGEQDYEGYPFKLLKKSGSLPKK